MKLISYIAHCLSNVGLTIILKLLSSAAAVIPIKNFVNPKNKNDVNSDVN